MKKNIFLTIICMLVLTSIEAQTTRNLKKTIELQMPKTVEDEYPGTRGASVVWHPLFKTYYANMAGNMLYPSGVFDVKGKRISDEELTTLADTRGLWYNPLTKSIEGNQYNYLGWFRYKLDKKGIQSEAIIFRDGMIQPDEQSVGCYDTKKNKIAFLQAAKVVFYNFKDTVATGFQTIHFGVSKKALISDDEDATIQPAGYNSSMIYTGLPNAEFGFLNTNDLQIELYSETTGLLTSVLKLPEDAIAEETFNFAYTNGNYWLFDMTNRKWVGYK